MQRRAFNALFLRLSLKQRLFAVLASLLVISVAISALGKFALRSNTQSISEVRKITATAQWLTLAAFQNEEMMRNLWAAFAGYGEGAAADATALSSVRSNLLKLEVLLERAPADPEAGPASARTLEKTLGKLRHSRERAQAHAEELAQGKLTAGELRARLQSTMEYAAAVNADVVESLVLASESSQRSHEKAARSEKRMNLAFLVAAVLGALAALNAIYFVIRLARALGVMSSNLRQMSDALQRATASIDETGRQLGAGVDQQLGAMTKSVAALEEFSAAIGQSFSSAETTLRHAEDAQSRAHAGMGQVAELRESMAQVASVHLEVSEFKQIIGEMERRTKVIHEIVFKTQMLAFNAAIEAARAGQHGRGFAVVAQEIGALAESSGKAAAEIRGLLAQSGGQSDRIIENIERRIRLAQGSTAKCLDAFTSISESISALVPMVEGVRSASSEQRIGIAQTQQSFAQINSAAGSNSLSARQISSIGPRLRSEAQEMGRFVDKLDVLVSGDHPGARARSRAA